MYTIKVINNKLTVLRNKPYASLFEFLKNKDPKIKDMCIITLYFASHNLTIMKSQLHTTIN